MAVKRCLKGCCHKLSKILENSKKHAKCFVFGFRFLDLLVQKLSTVPIIDVKCRNTVFVNYAPKLKAVFLMAVVYDATLTTVPLTPIRWSNDWNVCLRRVRLEFDFPVVSNRKL